MPDINLAVDPAELRKLHRLLEAIGKRHVRLIVGGTNVSRDDYETASKWAAICKTRLDAVERERG